MSDVRPNGLPVCFSVFEVDLNASELRKNGLRVKLQEQPFQVLRVLLDSPGQVVTREELQKRIWPSDTFVDFDHGLYNAVKKLREALGDVSDTPRFIETVPKRGYRFIGTLSSNGHSAADIGKEAPVNPAPQTHAAVATPTRERRRSRILLIAGLAGTIAVIIAVSARWGVIYARHRSSAVTAAPEIHSLAVLPLKNLSDDSTQEYFSYGMTDELITDLAQISGLKVISHTSVIQYANASKPLPQIARELGVDGIVEGTVQRSGNRVRITAQLIYAPQEQHLWAASYDRDLRDALTLQSSVAAAIVEPIRSKTAPTGPLPPRKASASPSLQAVEDYLQGNYSIYRMGAGDGYKGYEAAIQHFKQAISDDPDFAPAYVGLAHVYDAQFQWRSNEIMPLEKAAVEKALELDPSLADAHLMKAQIKMAYDCDLPGAESEFKETLRLNPSMAEAHDAFSGYLDSVGRHEESIREEQRAKELDPAGIDEIVDNGLGEHLDEPQAQQARVIEELRQHLKVHPDDGWAYMRLIDEYNAAGMHRESIEAMEQAWTLFGFKEIGQGVARAYATSGYEGALRYSAKQMEQLYAEGKVYESAWIAAWYARVGDKEQALKWVKVNLEDSNYCWIGLNRDPDFTLLHTDPRFQELVKRADPTEASR